MWISLGNYAEVALIFAQTDPEKGHRGLAAFLVPTATEGFSSDEIHGKMGLHGSDTAALNLDAVKVDDDALMGEVGEGFKIAMSALDSGRYSVAAGCVGICQGSLDASVAYAKEREQFGRPIGSFQLVQAMIADMRVMTDSARMLVYRAGFLKDQGRPSTTETSIAKLHATESAQSCAHLAIQVHGGSGYVDDHPVERYFRDVRVTTLYEGTSQIQKLIIGRAETGLNALVAVVAVGASSGSWAPARWAPASRSSPRRRARARSSTTPTPRRSSAGWPASPSGSSARSRRGGSRRARPGRSRRAAGGGRAGRRRHRDRGGARVARAQALAVRERRRGRARGLRAGDQHVVAERDRDRRGRARARARGRHALLQPRAGDEARRGGRRASSRARRRSRRRASSAARWAAT